MTEDPAKDSNPDDIDDFDGDEDDEDKGGDELSVEKTLQQEFSLIVKEIETKKLNIRKPPVLRSPVSLQSKEPKKVCFQQFFYTFQTFFPGVYSSDARTSCKGDDEEDHKEPSGGIRKYQVL